MMVAAELKIGIAMWLLSWPIGLLIDGEAFLAVFLTSYAAIVCGIVKTTKGKTDAH